ncbi:SurA N-terminal domain-containing protein, partial [Patescibacteria group bacterium]|nr:SurA N-terminal domain-containing protein [Patescibacteria group bacterium]
MADVLGGISSENNSSGRKKIILIVFVFLAIVAIPLTVYIAQKQQEIRQRASTGEPSTNAVAQINGQTINKDELEKAKGLFSYLKNKNAEDQKVKDEAMNFLIERRLLENEARKRGIFDKASTIANQRTDNLIAQYQDQKEAEKVLNIDMGTYRNYALNEAIKEGLEPIITKWRVVDYLSIRYLWHNAPELEELAFNTFSAS